MSFQEEIEVTIQDCLTLVETMRDIDPWIPIQTFHAYLIICYEVMTKKRIMRGVELAELMQTTQASATRNIQLLCKYGLIEIHHSPMNKVDRLIKMTRKGRYKMHMIRKVFVNEKGGNNERKTKRK